MFSSPLLKIFREFDKRKSELEGETKRNECRVRLGGVHLEIRYAPPAKKPAERNSRKLSVRIYEKEGGSFTELTLWEKIAAFMLMRRLHKYSRRNTRAEQIVLLPVLHSSRYKRQAMKSRESAQTN
jgi:hypothetical protein